MYKSQGETTSVIIVFSFTPSHPPRTPKFMYFGRVGGQALCCFGHPICVRGPLHAQGEKCSFALGLSVPYFDGIAVNSYGNHCKI